MSYRTGLIDAYNLIVEHINQLEEMVLSHQPDFMSVALLPKYTKQDELVFDKESTTKVTYSITPLLSATEAFSYHTIDSDESGVLLRRWPGVLVYNDEMREMQNLLVEIKEAKSSFRAIVNKYAQSASGKRSTSSAKFNFVHDVLPMTVTLYVYRRIHSIVGPVKACYWSWLASNDQRSFTKAQLIDHLSETIDNTIEFAAGADAKLHGLQTLLSNVRSSQHDEYVYQAKQPARPNLCVHFADGRKPQAIYGALPVFIFDQQGLDFKLTELKDRNPNLSEPAQLRKAQRKQRSDAVQLNHLFGDYYYRSGK